MEIQEILDKDQERFADLRGALSSTFVWNYSLNQGWKHVRFGNTLFMYDPSDHFVMDFHTFNAGSTKEFLTAWGEWIAFIKENTKAKVIRTTSPYSKIDTLLTKYHSEFHRRGNELMIRL